MEERKPPCTGKWKTMFPTVKDRHDKERSAGKLDPETASAKIICAQCFRIEDCLEDAYDMRERFGIWGGVNFGNKDERRDFLRDVEVKNVTFVQIANRTRNLIRKKAS